MPVWKPAAVEDRRAIARYIAKDSPQAAVAVVDAVMEQAVQLDANARMGRPGRVEGTREWVVHPNYVIVYRLIGAPEKVEILRVLHARQQWP